MSVWRVFKYRAGGEGEEVCPNESAIERFRSRIKEMNHTKNRKKRYQRGILAYVVMADGLVRWGLLNTTLQTLLKQVINCVHWLSSDLCLMVKEEIRNVINWCGKYKLQDDKSFTRHEKCIPRNRKNTNKEKVENFFNSRISRTFAVSHSCKNQNKKNK